MPDDAKSTATSRTKVGRLIGEYGLGEDYGAELEARWVGEETERESLRDLADRFNRQLLTVAMREAEMTTIDGEVENFFRLLTDDDVSAGVRTDARRRLERNGIDVEQLERDFITYQAIRSYLQDHRGAEYEKSSDEDRIERTVESIERLRLRLERVSENNLTQLRSADRIALDEFRLFVGVDVLCEACGSQYPISELMEQGGCDCREDRSSAQ